MGRKYFQSYTNICYQEAYYGFFKTISSKCYNMLFYEENGFFYELLTGTILGKRKGMGVFSNDFGFIFQLEGYHTQVNAREVPAEYFANEARKYIEDKNDILPYLNKIFDKWREEYKKKMEQEKLEQSAKTETLNWLDNLLNNR